MTGYVIGVDVGTASARAGLFDLTGKRLAIATEPIQIHRPLPEYAEQSSEDIWRAVCTVVRAVVSEARVQPDTVLGHRLRCDLLARRPRRQRPAAEHLAHRRPAVEHHHVDGSPRHRRDRRGERRRL
jgi:N-acetylglucosamine kinase-like BadF-type ATPase